MERKHWDEDISGGKKLPLVILTGPTAVGKTELSISLAKRLGGEIISADSIQVYRGMDIGSAKITPREQQGIRHYLIDVLDPDEAFNIYIFKQMAAQAVSEIYAKGKIPILTGGTGFYIQSILYDIQFQEEEDNRWRLYYEALAKEKGKEYLHRLLREVDGEYAESVHYNNEKRVIRALEFYRQTGRKLSEHNKIQQENESPFDFRYFVLNRDRKILYDRINRRVDLMLEQGLVEEVKHLLDSGYDRTLVSMQGLGYKEIAACLAGEMTLGEAAEIIKRDTRRFAKRQLTWFRREKNVTFINYEVFDNDTERILDAMVKMCSF